MPACLSISRSGPVCWQAGQRTTALGLYAPLGQNPAVWQHDELALDLTMPFMPMPPNNPKAVWQDNAYRGTAIFTMAGAWQVNVEVNRPGVETEIIIFDIEMVIMK